MSDVEVLPPGSAIVRLSEPTEIERAADPHQAVAVFLEQARLELVRAAGAEDVSYLIDAKDRVEHVRLWSVRRELGRDLERDASELMRRAERAIGKAIREGQERGEIKAKAQHDLTVNRHGSSPDLTKVRTSPRDLVPNHNELEDMYAFTDEVADDAFEAVLAEAKAEGNLTRSNIKRKLKVLLATACGARPTENTEKPKPAKPAKRPEYLRNTRHIDLNRVVNQTALAAQVDDTTFELLDGRYAELDPTLIEGWVCSLTEAIKALSRLRSNLKKEQTQ